MASGKSVRQRNYLLFNIFFLFVLIIFLGLFFRRIRDSLPPTEIGEHKIVGYAQYFGYPLFLDMMIFVMFIFVPVFVAILIKRRMKSKK